MRKSSEYRVAIRTALDGCSDGGGEDAGLATICERCILRLAGVRASWEYRKCVVSGSPAPSVPDGGSSSAESPSENKKRKVEPLPLPICRACLGVLQDAFMLPVLDQMAAAMASSGYDSETFTVSVSLPVSLALRSHSISLLLSEKLPDYDSGEAVPIKQVWKWLYPQKLEAKTGLKYNGGENSCPYFVELSLKFDGDSDELSRLTRMCEREYKMKQRQHRKYHMGLVTRQGAEKSLENVAPANFKAHYPVPPSCPKTPLTPEVAMSHNSIFLAGRYNKYSRMLPQTPWVLNGKRIMESSVEELICQPLSSAFAFERAKFVSSGREDVDVRMMGDGRPFLLEVVNPRKTLFTAAELSSMEGKVNQGSDLVQIRDLSVVPKDAARLIKEGEDEKRKTYEALCLVPRPEFSDSLREKLVGLEELGTVELTQKTPLRVLHRRANCDRKRSVYQMCATVFDDDLQKNGAYFMFKLKLCTQAGTYVKEFVHGDFGRTKPNLRLLLGCDSVDIVGLDVMVLAFPLNY